MRELIAGKDIRHEIEIRNQGFYHACMYRYRWRFCDAVYQPPDGRGAGWLIETKRNAMHTDIPTAIFGMATMMAFVGAILVTVIYFRMDGPWQQRLGFLGSILNGIFAALSALCLVAGFILPESSMLYDQLVAQRTMHAIALVVTMSSAALLWVMSIRWRGPGVRHLIAKQITHG